MVFMAFFVVLVITAASIRFGNVGPIVAKRNSKVNGVFAKNVIISHNQPQYELCNMHKNEPLSPRNWKFHGRSRSAAPNTKNDIDGQTYDNTEQYPLHFLRYPVK